MPVGLRVTTGALPGATNNVPDSARYIVAAPTAKGPAEPTVVRSIAQFAALFGARTMSTAVVYDTVELFFAEGGGEAVIARVFGDGASGDSVVLKDTTPVTPADAIRLTAKGLGAASGLTVTVTAAALVISVDGTKRETYTASGVADLLELLGDSALVNAVYVGVGEATNAVTLAAGDFPLVGGSADAENVVTADYVQPIKLALLHSPSAAYGTPGHYPGLAGIATLADAGGNNDFIGGTARGESYNASGWSITDTVGLRDNAVGAYPWVRVPDSDRTKLVPAEGYLAAVRARAHDRIGFWQVPAGAYSVARYIVGLAETVPVPNDFELLSRLNPINVDRGRITLGDYRAATSTPENIVMATESDSMASLVAGLSDVFRGYVFETIDSRGQLFSEMVGSAEAFLGPLAEAGALYARLDAEGELVDPGYRVTIDASNNTPESLAQNIINVTVGVRLSPTGRLIDLRILRVPLNGAL